MSDLTSRHVPSAERPRPLVISCPQRVHGERCGTEMYQVKPGEHLSRSKVYPGWRLVDRHLQCPTCGHRQTIQVQIRTAE